MRKLILLPLLLFAIIIIYLLLFSFLSLYELIWWFWKRNNVLYSNFCFVDLTIFFISTLIWFLCAWYYRHYHHHDLFPFSTLIYCSNKGSWNKETLFLLLTLKSLGNYLWIVEKRNELRSKLLYSVAFFPLFILI